MADVAAGEPEADASAWLAGVDAAAEALTQRAADLQTVLAERADRARRLAERAGALTFEASGAQGAVRARVSVSGALVGLDLTEQVRQWPAERIAAEILATAARAQASIAAGVRPVLDETVGADSATGRAILAQYAARFPAPEVGTSGSGAPTPDRSGRAAH